MDRSVKYVLLLCQFFFFLLLGNFSSSQLVGYVRSHFTSEPLNLEKKDFFCYWKFVISFVKQIYLILEFYDPQNCYYSFSFYEGAVYVQLN